jgi:hypothetical protein
MSLQRRDDAGAVELSMESGDLLLGADDDEPERMQSGETEGDCVFCAEIHASR